MTNTHSPKHFTEKMPAIHLHLLIYSTFNVLRCRPLKPQNSKTTMDNLSWQAVLSPCSWINFTLHLAASSSKEFGFVFQTFYTLWNLRVCCFYVLWCQRTNIQLVHNIKLTSEISNSMRKSMNINQQYQVPAGASPSPYAYCCDSTVHLTLIKVLVIPIRREIESEE